MVSTIVLLYGIQVVNTNIHPQDTLIILGYHHIVPDEDKEMYYPHNMWVASLSDFKAQMKLLSEMGYHTVSLDDVYAWRMGNKELDAKSVAITFDDGFLSSTLFAQPVLKEYGFCGSVFVIGSLINNQHGSYDPMKRQHASLADMNDQSTLHYYSHTYDLHHKKHGVFKIDTLDETALLDDYKKQSHLVSNRYVAYPYGKSNERIKNVLKAQGTRLAFGFNENRKATKQDDPYSLPRFCVNAYTKLDVFRTMLESR